MARFIPVVLFLLLSILLFFGLHLNPQRVPSTLLDKKLPPFRLKSLSNNKFVSSGSLKGRVWLLNVWASWCEACKDEQPLLLRLHRQKVAIIGLVYQDDRRSVSDWLHQNGHAFNAVLFDEDGMAAINLGVYGTPETFIIDKKGIIRYKHIGLLTRDEWLHKLGPIYHKLNS